MSHIKLFTIDFNHNRFSMNLHAQFFFKIAEHPHIMITCKKMNFNSFVCQLGNFPLKPYKSFRNSLFIFKPEIKYIDRKSTRLNSSHVRISYAVFCLKKKKKKR